MDSRRPRQAVVIIHGIGEQRPMDTLRSFVKTVRGNALSKPDHLSPTLELRRMAVPGDDKAAWKPGDQVSTDFYELYWAHLMTGTSWNHVTAWLGTIMLRFPWHVPSRLVAIWLLGWLVLIAIAAASPWVAQHFKVAEWTITGILTSAAVLFCTSTGRYLGLQYLGDAARYLSATPANVGVRQSIRSAAVELLEKLHDDPDWRRYHRIILVGHSLGSVVGYDAITHLWQRRHHPKSPGPEKVKQDALERYEAVLSKEARIADPRELQTALWREQRRLGVQWKITDFVTLGSPLAHASFLMAANRGEFRSRVEQREFPTCPPQKNDERDRDYGFSLVTVKPTGNSILHHAAPFACTRWTNLYFDKDFIGGSVSDFGEWIQDWRITTSFTTLFPHTHYWLGGLGRDQLLAALDLDGWWTEQNTEAALSTQERDTDLLRDADPLR